MIALGILAGFGLFIWYVWEDFSDLIADEIGAGGDPAELGLALEGTTATAGADTSPERP